MNKHLEVTGLKTVCKLRSLTDRGFCGDFGQPEDLEAAAVRKLAELKKETSERAAKNPARYEKFSDRIKELIRQFNAGLLNAEETLDETERLAREILAEDDAHKGSGLNERAYGVHAILESFETQPGILAEPPPPPWGAAGEPALTPIQQAALAIDSLYASDQTATAYWQEKTQLKKDLHLGDEVMKVFRVG
jgi:type I restriction enzyme R subunit